MKKTASIVLTLALALSVSPLWASGSSAPPTVGAVQPSANPLLVTETMKCRVTELADRGQVKIQDPKTQEESWIQVTEDTKLVAQDKKAFDGRRKLDTADLEVGQLLRITHRPHTGEVVKVKVLRDA